MKKKIKRIIIFLVVAIIVFLLIKFIYQYWFIRRLKEATQKVYDSGNYSCYYYIRGTKLDDETGEWISTYSKMGLEVKDGKLAFIGYDNEASGYKLLSKNYQDRENPKENVCVEFNDNTFSISPNIMPMEYREKLINYPQFNNLQFNYIIIGSFYGEATLKAKIYCFIENLKYFISNIVRFKVDKLTEDGKEYYVIKDNDDNKKYINKDTLLVEKEIMNIDGEEVVNAIFEIEIGNVTDEDVTVPDLTNFRQDIL